MRQLRGQAKGQKGKVGVAIVLGILVVVLAIAICMALPHNSEEPQGEAKEEYDFGKAVPESEPVGEEYFDDAIFIGNSRTEGFFLYTGLKGAKMYACQGLMVDTFFTDNDYLLEGERVSMLRAIKANPDFRKVYIMLGMNELGWVYSDNFIEKYGDIIDEMREISPDATVYVQSILPVSREKSENSDIYNLKKICRYNRKLKKMCEEKEVYYVNVFGAVANKEGYLPEGAAYDGVHLKADYCRKWIEYLECHTIKED